MRGRGRLGVGLALGMLVGAACDAGAPAHELTMPGLDLGSLELGVAGRVDVAVTPVLGRVALGEACVGVRVTDQRGRTLEADEALCGRPGELSFAGACDATAPQHTVTVWLDELTDLADRPLAAGAWANPCVGDTSDPDPSRWSGGCQMAFACQQGKSASVAFNLFVDPGTSGVEGHPGCGD